MMLQKPRHTSLSFKKENNKKVTPMQEWVKYRQVYKGVFLLKIKQDDMSRSILA